jgi:hypothetical protein
VCKYILFEDATETVVVGQRDNKIIFSRPIFIINMTTPSVYIRSCYICLRKPSNESDAFYVIKMQVSSIT